MQVASEWFLHMNTSKTSCGNSIESYISPTPTFAVSGGAYCLRGGGWTQACAAGIQEVIWLCIYTIEFALNFTYSPDEGMKWHQWTIGRTESWKAAVIWALFWWCDRHHPRRRIQWPDNPSRYSGDRHGKCQAYSSPLCGVCESLCHECSGDCPDS